MVDEIVDEVHAIQGQRMFRVTTAHTGLDEALAHFQVDARQRSRGWR
jgi:N-acetyl-beta-hexosaminidase